MINNGCPPKISIGMPVRNEILYIRKSIESILAQTNISFELIISDNASTDGTTDICREYAQKHPDLIRFECLQDNIGASANFSKVRDLATGEYFIWVSGHDLWDEQYLSVCSKALDKMPEAILAFGNTRWIDAHDAIHTRQTGYSDTRGLSLPARYFTVFWGNMNPIIALIRRPVLQQLKFSDMVGIDLCILLQLALQGNFIHCPETSWSRREFRDENDYKQKLERYKSKDYALGTSFLSKLFPLAALPLRIIKDVLKAKIGLLNKCIILLILLPSLPMKYLTDSKSD